MLRLLLLLALTALSAGCASWRTKPAGPADPAAADGLFAEIGTPRGPILARLEFEKAPLTVMSFVGLAEGTLGPAPRKPYFDGLAFHRVVSGFVIQGGDPTGTGRGGPGYRFPDEFFAGQRHDGPGLLSMANSGPDTNGSQFFITLGEARYLDYVHSIFGRVVRGAELLPAIRRGDTMTVKIIRRGSAAQRFKADEKTFAVALARAARWTPPALEDKTRLATGAPPWQAKYLENRLNNLTRFTGRRILVRLADSFEPDGPGQTEAQAVTQLHARLGLPPEAILAAYALDEQRWYLAGGPAGLALPDLAPEADDAGRPPTQNRLYTEAGKVVSHLIDRTDPE